MDERLHPQTHRRHHSAARASCDRGKVWTTSLQVAEYFGNRHFHVQRDIEKLGCSAAVNASQF